MPKLIDIAVLAGLIAVVPLGAQTMPAALVASFEGPVQIRVSGSDPEPAAVGQRLEVGDEILPGEGGRVVLVTRTGAAQIITQSTVIQDAPAASGSSVMARTIGVLAQAATSDARSWWRRSRTPRNDQADSGPDYAGLAPERACGTVRPSHFRMDRDAGTDL